MQRLAAVNEGTVGGRMRAACSMGQPVACSCNTHIDDLAAATDRSGHNLEMLRDGAALRRRHTGTHHQLTHDSSSRFRPGDA